MPTVFSALFDEKISCASSLTKAPATPARFGMENRCLSWSKTSTASFAVCAT